MLAGVSIGDLVRFQFGDRRAIEAVARNRHSIWIGAILVLLTAVARNYDQTFILESPLWLFGPLLFSFVSGYFLFCVLHWAFFRRRFAKEVSWKEQWRRFMGLFWATAPVAWLYAIPVERFFPSYRAAQANLALLGAVSLWRVLLMARVVSVMQEVRFGRAVGWVLVPASLQVLLVVTVGQVFSPAFGKRVMAGMSGMRNAPEEDLLLSALGTALVGALVVLAIVGVCLALAREETREVRPFPVQTDASFPGAGLAVVVGVWIALAIGPQLEQRRFITHAGLIEKGEHREAIEYLGRHVRGDFPASRRLEPNPYERRCFEEMPKVMTSLRPDDPDWVRQLYVGHMDALFSHRSIGCDPSELRDLFAGLGKLPEAKSWVERNRTNLWKIDLARKQRPAVDAGSRQAKGAEELDQVLSRLGVTDKDLQGYTSRTKL